jgi:hypothetical protein
MEKEKEKEKEKGKDPVNIGCAAFVIDTTAVVAMRRMLTSACAAKQPFETEATTASTT